MSTTDIGSYIAKHYNHGKSASQIAADLSRLTGARITRNVVTGWAWRNGLSVSKVVTTAAGDTSATFLITLPLGQTYDPATKELSPRWPAPLPRKGGGCV